MLFFWIVVAAYLVAQTLVIVRATGWRRLAAALPLVIMVPVTWWTYVGVREGSNLAPLLFLIAAPFVLAPLTFVMLHQDPKPHAS